MIPGYLCRYCLLTRTEFQGADPAVCGPQRTPETYRFATEQLEREDVRQVQRIKFRSVFNSLQNFDESVEFGEHLLIFVKDDSAVHFLMRLYDAEFISYYHMYSVKKDTGRLECRLISELIDLWPLSSYVKNGYQIIPLKHSILSALIPLDPRPNSLFVCLNKYG